MTHPTYTQQALCRYNLPRLKRIAAERGVTPTGDKRAAQTWVNAIITHQSTQLHKVDNQATAQAKLDNFIADQAQAVAPEPLTIVEISFDHHEYYADDKLVASISHDDSHLTQRWVVMVNDKEVFRANTLMRCDRFCDLKKILDRLSSFTFQKWMSKFTFQKHLRNDIRKSKRLKPYVHIQDNAFGNSDAIASGKTCEESGSREKSPKSRIKADLCPFSSSISVILSIFFFQTSDRLINALTKL